MVDYSGMFRADPRIKRRRRFADTLQAQALRPIQAPANPYGFNPLAEALQRVTAAYGGSMASSAAEQREAEQKAAQAAIAQALMGKGVPAATAPAAPQPTDFLSRAKQAIFPSVPTVSQSMGKYAGATTITPEMMADAGADPLQMELSKRTIAAQDLTLKQQTALRTVRTLQNQKAAAGALTPDEQKTYDAALQNLPADVSALNTLDVKKDAEGNVIGHQIIDIFGNPVSMKYAPASATSINLAGPKAEREAVGKGRGKTLEKLEFAADDATQNLAIIEQALDLYARGEIAGKSNFTGTGVETILNFKSAIAGIGNAFGFDPEELGIDIDKISDQQTLRSALNQMVLKRTQLIKGALSDRELLFSAEATANFGNTPTANQMILLFQKRAGIRAQELAELANEYFDTFGTFGGTKGEKFHGKEYKSFRQFQNEYKNQDAIIGVGMIGEINSVPQLSAYIKLRGGTKRLTEDESRAILGRREQLTR